MKYLNNMNRKNNQSTENWKHTFADRGAAFSMQT